MHRWPSLAAAGLLAGVVLGCGSPSPDASALDVADATIEANFSTYTGTPVPVTVQRLETLEDTMTRAFLSFDRDSLGTQYYVDLPVGSSSVRRYGPGVANVIVTEARAVAWEQFGSLPATTQGMEFVERNWSSSHDGAPMPADTMVQKVREWGGDRVDFQGVEMVPLGEPGVDRIYVARYAAEPGTLCVISLPFNRSYPEGFNWLDRPMYAYDRFTPVCRASSGRVYHPEQFASSVRERLVGAKLIDPPTGG